MNSNNYISSFKVVLLTLLLISNFSYNCVAQETISAKVLQDKGKLNEAAWQFAIEGDSIKSKKILSEIENVLLFNEIDETRTDTKQNLNGMEKTFRVYFKNSPITAIFKLKRKNRKIDKVKHERAAYNISNYLDLNLVPVVVVRTISVNGKDYYGSLMYWVDDAVTARNARLSYKNKTDFLPFFDALISNIDRHHENWMIGLNEKIIAIDHNLAFDFKTNIWMDNLQEVRNPIEITNSKSFKILKKTNKEQYYKLFENFDDNQLEAAWQVRNRIIFHIENSIVGKDIRLTETVLPDFIQFNLVEPILMKNSIVEKLLSFIVLEHMPHETWSIRRDGMFLVWIYDSNGKAKSALGGIKVYKDDAERIRKILINSGFKIEYK